MNSELRFTDKEIIAWGGMALMERMLWVRYKSVQLFVCTLVLGLNVLTRKLSPFIFRKKTPEGVYKNR